MLESQLFMMEKKFVEGKIYPGVRGDTVSSSEHLPRGESAVKLMQMFECEVRERSSVFALFRAQ